MKISCPKCNWKPDRGEYWQCNCLYVWNTFNTGGRCLNCSKVWKVTQCPGPEFPGGCGVVSDHIDWYRDLNTELKEDLQKLVKKKPTKQDSCVIESKISSDILKLRQKAMY